MSKDIIIEKPHQKWCGFSITRRNYSLSPNNPLTVLCALDALCSGVSTILTIVFLLIDFAFLIRETNVSISHTRSNNKTILYPKRVTCTDVVSVNIAMVSPILIYNVVINHKRPKLNNDSFSLKPKYAVTKFLNLKLIFHPIRARRDTSNINDVFPKAPDTRNTKREGAAGSAGLILTIGRITIKKARTKRYNTNSFCCFVYLPILWRKRSAYFFHFWSTCIAMRTTYKDKVMKDVW